MIRSLIVAIAENNAIGKNNDLLWHIPEDMKFFRKTTSGHCIITGRKNYDSIPEKYRPLANRTNIIVTRNKGYSADEGTVVQHTIEAAFGYAKSKGEEEVFVIGGGQVYKECLDKNLIDKMYITHVSASFDADTFFPAIDYDKWVPIEELMLRAEKLAAKTVVYNRK